jgi:hypothetical protein
MRISKRAGLKSAYIRKDLRRFIHGGWEECLLGIECEVLDDNRNPILNWEEIPDNRNVKIGFIHPHTGGRHHFLMVRKEIESTI